MSFELLALVIAARFMTASLVPLTDERARLADEIARSVDEDRAFFKDDPDKIRTLALHVAVAYRESTLVWTAIGDGGTSFCAFQINDSNGGTIELTRNMRACVRAGHDNLRRSIRQCREHPIAVYARGPRGCWTDEAQKISADRLALGDRLALVLHHPRR